MPMIDKLVISETFFSIQGEGSYAGAPAVFLRLAGCNLRCKGFSFKYPKSGEVIGCDTAHIWQRGSHFTFHDLLDFWYQRKWIKKLLDGAHLVITGGEPGLQQPALTYFINYLDFTFRKEIFIEIETNATIEFNQELTKRINIFNVSPKLSNSGEPIHKAYSFDVLKKYAQLDKALFKFVISHENDINEIIENYVKPLRLQSTKVWLMPEGGDLSELNKKDKFVVELCKSYCMNFSPRLQIYIWNEATGV